MSAEIKTVPVSTVQKAVDYVATQFAKTGDHGVFLQDIYDKVKVLSVSYDAAEIPTVSFQVHTVEKLRNSMKMVHGGASSSLIGLHSQLALAASPKYWKDPESPTEEELKAFYNDLGKTRAMDIQIIQAVPLNADVTVSCQVLSNTKSNAFINSAIYNSAGRLLVHGTRDVMKTAPGSPDKHDPKDLKAHFNPKSHL